MTYMQIAGSPAWYHELHGQLIAGDETRYGTVDFWREELSEDGRGRAVLRLYVSFQPLPYPDIFTTAGRERLTSVCWIFDAAELAEWEAEQIEEKGSNRV